VTNTSNGERWQTATSARGRFFIEYLSVGGPYRIEVHAVGYQPAQRDSIFLALGQRLTAQFVLVPAIPQLEEITVTGKADPRFSSAHTGPAQIISDSMIARLPVRVRAYTELALLSPQVTISPNGGLSFGGQHDRFNSIQVDGVTNNDLFGCACSGTGTPGWAVGLNTFTPEAVKELQVVSAPFDVRYGNFAGGLINAVTRSGSNQVEGSIVGYIEGSALSGSSGNQVNDFSRGEFGFTLGAPIVRDRVALFVNAAVQRQVFDQSVPAPGSDTTGGADSAGVGIRHQSLVRFQNILRRDGVEPGAFTRGDFSAPTQNFFAKLTVQLGVNSRLELSHNYGHGTARDETGPRSPGFYGLSSNGRETPETVNATRMAWTAALGSHYSNELLLARVEDRRTCHPNSGFPEVFVAADAGGMSAGTADLCLGLETGFKIWELTDNFGVTAGSHRLTFGTHGELIDLVDDALVSPAGQWTFESLDSLELGQASSYARDLAGPAGAQVAFQVRQIGFYVQDQWVPTSRLTLTAGLRLDVPFLPTPPVQNAIALNTLGINTALTPSGNILWAPRLGVNYDLSGKGTTVLRGGVGLFAGRPAYQWFKNVYNTTGAKTLRLVCQDSATPSFTLDPGNQPSACAVPIPQRRPLNYFDPDFRFPRNLKLAVGVDHLLPGGIVGTMDFLYTRGVNTFNIVDVNLTGPVATAAGEGGRAIYGTIDPTTGEAAPNRRTAALGGVYEIRNGSGDRAYSITAQLQRRFPNGIEWSAAYTYTNAKDRMSTDGDLAITNASSTPVNGSLEHRELGTSLWETRHKVTLMGAADLPLGFRFSLTYNGISGAPFTYVLLGDPNADGFAPGASFGVSNDVVYVPRDAADITLADPAEFASLDRIIRGEPCLRDQRGRLLQRNSCHNPWGHDVEARVAKRFPLADRRVLEVTADLFNVLNFLDGDWGLVRQTEAQGNGNAVPLLRLVGYDAAHGRGIYQVVPVFRQIDQGSRWSVQLGGTVFF
jgi:hypothetical protein